MHPYVPSVGATRGYIWQIYEEIGARKLLIFKFIHDGSHSRLLATNGPASETIGRQISQASSTTPSSSTCPLLDLRK